ncbi:MAG: MoaD/ThiS family protein [Promethearchaeota archaeon]
MSNNEISVTVKFFATLREFGPDNEIIKIPEKSKVKLLFEKYNIPRDNRRAIILVNGKPHKNQETILNDGDVIAVFPPIGGG